MYPQTEGGEKINIYFFGVALDTQRSGFSFFQSHLKVPTCFLSPKDLTRQLSNLNLVVSSFSEGISLWIKTSRVL